MMTRTVQIHLGETIEQATQRFVDGWQRAEAGALTTTNAELHIGFDSLSEMARVLSPTRLEVLRHLHRRPVKSIRQLAADMGRNYPRVHGDVAALQAAGLIERDEDGLHADYVAFDVTLRIAL